MGFWTRIRGWIELSDAMIPIVYQTIEASIGDAVRFGVSEEAAEAWNEGWVLPTEPRAWTPYAFYGNDVRARAVPFVRHQMDLIAGITTGSLGDSEQPVGIIHVAPDAGAGSLPRIWELRDGRLYESLQHAVSPSDRHMRFFTRDWIDGALPDELAEEVPTAYRRHLDALDLPPSLAALVGLYLHDAWILGVEHSAVQSSLTLRLRCGDLQRGYTDTHVRYAGVRAPQLSLAALHSARRPADAAILYDEVDWNGSQYVHRFLLWPEAEVEIAFEGVEIDVVPVADRWVD